MVGDRDDDDVDGRDVTGAGGEAGHGDASGTRGGDGASDVGDDVGRAGTTGVDRGSSVEADDDAASRAGSQGGGPGMDRRKFLTGAAVAGGALVAGAGIYGITRVASGGPTSRRPPARPRTMASSTTTTTVPGARLAPTASGVLLPISPAIVAENAKPGHAWWVTTAQQAGDIEGFADRVSAVSGDAVTLYVSTKATHFHVEAYRMGYYQGIGARLVWQSDEVAGIRQPSPTLVAPTNTIECQWSPSLTFTVDATWPPGAYLLKLVGATSEQQFVPLCIRDDTSRAAVVIQHSVTTWQAYNRWGGYSLYFGNSGGRLSFVHAPGAAGSFADRARIVSFDRPYDHDWASGAADFVGNELPVLYQAERLGLDVTYWTDVDFHARPQLLANHRALVSLGHDEYWSLQMRDGARQALDAGTNLAFLGANASYRQIRMQPSALGPDRLQVCYKSATEDPMYGVDDAIVTVNWPQPPVSRPECRLIGSTYQDIGARADLVVRDPSSWLFAGTGLAAGQHLPLVVQGEFDRYVPGQEGPTNVDILAHSLVANRGGNYSDITWYTTPSGGGVFASGTATWVGSITGSSAIPGNVLPPASPAVTGPLQRAMENLYAVIATGPASASQPSSGTWRSAYRSSGSIPAGTPSNAD